MKRVLVTGAGGPLGVNLTRSLKLAPEQLFLVGTDCNKFHLPLALTDKTELIVPASDEKKYIDVINALVEKYKIDLIFPSHPLEVWVLGKYRDKIDSKLFLPSQEAIDKGNSKYSSYNEFDKKGLPVPATFLLEAKSDLTFAIAHLNKMPIWVRAIGTPQVGMGGKALKCSNEDEARSWVDYWKGWGHFMVSEYLPGNNMTWASLWKGGKLIASQGRHRLEYVLPHVSQSGITGAPAVSKTVRNKKLDRIGENAVLAIDKKPSGTYFVDLKADEEGELKITEINVGRFGTTIHFYTAAGLNFPYLYLKSALGEKTEGIPKYNSLGEGFYWIRTLDCGPVLLKEEDLAK